MPIRAHDAACKTARHMVPGTCARVSRAVRRPRPLGIQGIQPTPDVFLVLGPSVTCPPQMSSRRTMMSSRYLRPATATTATLTRQRSWILYAAAEAALAAAGVAPAASCGVGSRRQAKRTPAVRIQVAPTSARAR